MVKIFQEARALLGRVEYQRGHIEEALRVFDGIKVSTLIPEMKISIARKVGQQKPRPYSSSPALSFHAVTVLMETIYLKALVLNDLGRFEGRDPASLFFFSLLCFAFLLKTLLDVAPTIFWFCRSCTRVQYNIGHCGICCT